MKFLLVMIILVANFSVSAQVDTEMTQEFKDAEKVFQSAKTPSLHELQSGKIWFCKSAFRPIENYEEVEEEGEIGFVFDEFANGVRDLNFKNNLFKRYKFKDGELISKKVLFLGASVTNTLRISGTKLVTEIKISGFIGKMVESTGDSGILGYLICE